MDDEDEEKDEETKRLRVPKIKARSNGRKDMCPCGDPTCDGSCQKNLNGQYGQKNPALIAQAIPAIVGAVSGNGLKSHERGYLKDGSGFLGELAEPTSQLDEEGRMKSYHYHKAFEGIDQLQEAHDDLEQTPTEQDVPAADFEPGPYDSGAKGAIGAIAGHPRVQAAARGAVRGAVEGFTAGKEVEPGSPEWEQEEMAEGHSAPPGSEQFGQEEAQEPEHMKTIRGASGFFKELAFARDFGDPHRQKAAYWKSAIDPLYAEEQMEETVEDKQDEPGIVMEGEEERKPEEDEVMGEMGEKSLASILAKQDREMGELASRLARLNF
ncbi:MAG: hypothetical protein Q7O66_19800 [Dehalococcoidia bacterium]|nr:hypothetical protein [Dehalococcoidia bacterium]